MSQVPRIRVKRGETFLQECTVSEDDGTPMNITGWTIASQIRGAGDSLIASLVVNIHTPAAGQYRLTGTGTGEWLAGLAQMDIAYTDVSGRALSTETLAVTIEREVTRR